MFNKESFKTVYTAGSQPEAYIVKGKLESADIPVLLKYESAGLVYGITVDGLGKVDVQVPESMASMAIALLNDTPQQDTIPPDSAAD